MDKVLLDVRHISHRFGSVLAVNDVSFQIKRGEIFGLVGESGSGKSTLARLIMSIYRPTVGSILFDGIDLGDKKQLLQHRAMLQSARQLIFQDSASSLDPRWRVCDIIAEPMRLHKIKPPRGSYRAEAAFQLRYVGLDPSYLDKYPAELSGGMRQRVAIARALTMEPQLLVADEPVASLDSPIRAQILNLFAHLQKEHGFTFLLIAHDLDVVRYLSDRIGVMYRGSLVELAPAAELFSAPLHPYTKALLSAIPVPDPSRQKKRPPVQAVYRTAGRWTRINDEHFVREAEA